MFLEKLNVKVLLLNNQHLGMVMQWEDRFYKANRAHTYLGLPEAGHEWHVTFNEADIYPNFPAMAASFNIPSRRVIKKEEMRAAIREMLDTPGPYLLEVSRTCDLFGGLEPIQIDVAAGDGPAHRARAADDPRRSLFQRHHHR